MSLPSPKSPEGNNPLLFSCWAISFRILSQKFALSWGVLKTSKPGMENFLCGRVLCFFMLLQHTPWCNAYLFYKTCLASSLWISIISCDRTWRRLSHAEIILPLITRFKKIPRHRHVTCAWIFILLSIEVCGSDKIWFVFLYIRLGETSSK